MHTSSTETSLKSLEKRSEVGGIDLGVLSPRERKEAVNNPEFPHESVDSGEKKHEQGQGLRKTNAR